MSWNPVFPFYATITVVAILLAVFLSLEWRRELPYLFLRILAVWVAWLGLVLLMMRPEIETAKAEVASLLLTKDYIRNSIDSLIRTGTYRIYRMKDASPYPGSEELTHPGQIASIRNLSVVAGEGVPPYLTNAFSFRFLPALKPTGIVGLSYGAGKANRMLEIRGRFNGNQNTKLVLRSPAGVEDSVIVKRETFTLHALPKTSGPFTYYLKMDGDTVNYELPVTIAGERKLNLLWLQDYPTFESRFLKNFLADKGHSLAIRYQVSKNLTRSEFANRSSENLDRLTPALMKSMDAVLMTTSASAALPASSWESLQGAMREGLGLILLVDSGVPWPKRLQGLMPTATNTSVDTTGVELTWARKRITMDAPSVVLQSNPAVNPLVRDALGSVVAGYMDSDAGRVGFQLLPTTHKVALEGYEFDYAELWVAMLEAVSRREARSFEMDIESPFPRYADEPVTIRVISESMAPRLMMDGLTVPLIEDVRLDNVWYGTVYGSAGWHRLTLQDSTMLHLHLAPSGSWEALRQHNFLEHTASIPSPSEVQHEALVKEPLPALIGFLLLLTGCAFLWLAPKL